MGGGLSSLKTKRVRSTLPAPGAPGKPPAGTGTRCTADLFGCTTFGSLAVSLVNPPELCTRGAAFRPRARPRSGHGTTYERRGSGHSGRRRGPKPRAPGLLLTLHSASLSSPPGTVAWNTLRTSRGAQAHPTSQGRQRLPSYPRSLCYYHSRSCSGLPRHGYEALRPSEF